MSILSASSAPSAVIPSPERRKDARSRYSFDLDMDAWLFICRDLTRLQFAALSREEQTEIRGLYIDDTDWQMRMRGSVTLGPKSAGKVSA